MKAESGVVPSTHCPVCHSQIESVFGMFQCGHCQSILFVDFAGNIIVGGSESEDQDSSDDMLNDPQKNLDSQEAFGEGFMVSEPSEGEKISGIESEEDTDVGDIELTTHEYSAVHTEEFGNISNDGSGEVENAPSWAAPAPEPGTPVEDEVLQAPEEPLFPVDPIHSDLSSGPVGPMNYTIQIKGIDTAHLRVSVLSALSDKRLGLVGGEISDKIEQGQLVITGLNPVKASVLMNTLKELSLEIDWKLYGREESTDSTGDI